MRWLGGNGSEGLAGGSTILEAVMSGEHMRAAAVFDVRREPGVSHRAMMSPDPARSLSAEITSQQFLRSGAGGG